MSRLEEVREAVDRLLRQQPDVETRRSGFVHLYGVSSVCALLAFKRHLNPELCATAGMLHDVWSYKTGDRTDHARLGALVAEEILLALGCFAPEEIATICGAIARHSDKAAHDGQVDELLKDADVVQHVLYAAPQVVELSETRQPSDAASAPWIRRWRQVFGELGLSADVFTGT